MTLENGEAGSPSPNLYLTDAEATAMNLTLTGHNYSPARKLWAAALPAGTKTLTNLSVYSMLEVKNRSGADITVTFNEDTNGAIVLADDEIQSWEYNRSIYKVVITGAGSDPVYVYGYWPGIPR